MHIAWPLLQEFAHVHVGVLAPRAAADEHIAKGDPLMPAPHRWHRDALHPIDLGRSLLPGGRARTFLTHAVGSHQGIKEGFLAPLHQPRNSRERKHRHLRRLCENNDGICLQETHGKIEFPSGFTRFGYSVSQVGNICQRSGQRWRLGDAHSEDASAWRRFAYACGHTTGPLSIS